MKVLTRKGLAANGSITSTSVLVYMALHDDDTLRFSGKRMGRITDWVVQRSAFINHDPGKLIACREQITRHGLDYQLEQDFIRVLLKGLGYTGKEEYTGAREGAEAAYTLIFLPGPARTVWPGYATLTVDPTAHKKLCLVYP